MRTCQPFTVTLLCCALLACGGDEFGGDDDGDLEPPVDVSGNYLLTVTSRANGCGFLNWQEDASSPGVPLYITQEDRDVEATIGGITGGLVDLWLGERTFDGRVEGHRIDVALVGTKAQTLGDCSYTIDVAAEATLEGDTLEGTLVYSANTAGRPACAALAGCSSHQEFVGPRPTD